VENQASNLQNAMRIWECTKLQKWA